MMMEMVKWNRKKRRRKTLKFKLSKIFFFFFFISFIIISSRNSVKKRKKIFFLDGILHFFFNKFFFFSLNLFSPIHLSLFTSMFTHPHHRIEKKYATQYPSTTWAIKNLQILLQINRPGSRIHPPP